MDIKVGDLVKIASSNFGAQFGVVIGGATHAFPEGDLKYKILMYNAGLGQYTDDVHSSYLEVITPVGRL